MLLLKGKVMRNRSKSILILFLCKVQSLTMALVLVARVMSLNRHKSVKLTMMTRLQEVTAPNG